MTSITYTIEALDADGNIRDTCRLPAGVTVQQAAAALILRVPTSMHPDDSARLAIEVQAAIGKKTQLVITVPDYVVACRLVAPPEPAEPPA